MKIILAGSTGFIGSEVLARCLEHPSITSIIALSRRELPPAASNNAKVNVVTMDDFLSYPDHVLQDIRGADACIWSLGKAWMPDNDTARKVCLDYTIAAAKAFSGTCPPADEGRKFRFVYLSGGAAERDQTKQLWFKQEYRRIRGQVENELLAYAGEHQDRFEAFIVRPGMVLAQQANLRDMIRGLGPSVRLDILARMMLRTALEGSEDHILDNESITLASPCGRA